MYTYKQTVKERSRELLWNHSVRSLTQSRLDSRVLNPEYLDRLWDYVKSSFDKSIYYSSVVLDDLVYEDWKKFGETLYGVRRPEELKVAFFCGPEPENDVNHLVRLGVRIENIYAFENDKTSFKVAVDSLHDSFPNLKIFRGNILDFLSLNEVKFDIIYLDFTCSLLTDFKTVFAILDSNVLADLGILIVNTTFPDKTSDAETYKKNIEKVLDIKSFIKYESIAYLCGNFDDLRNNANNYYLYIASTTNMAYIIPYDFDRCFGMGAEGRKNYMTDFSPESTKMQANEDWQKSTIYWRTICSSTDSKSGFSSTKRVEEYRALYQKNIEDLLNNKIVSYDSFKTYANEYPSSYRGNPDGSGKDNTSFNNYLSLKIAAIKKSNSDGLINYDIK